MSKPFKSQITLEAEKNLASFKKKTNKKETNTMKKTVLTTVAITLASIATLGLMFYTGMKYEQSINNRVVSQVKELTATTAQSKQ